MAKDKFSALWVSHSSMNDFLTCPRAYFLRAIYKDPSSGNKITVMSPPLALGQVVHDVIEGLSILPAEDRFSIPLMHKFEIAWKEVSGKKGGFFTDEEESVYKQRGKKMIERVTNNPGPLKKKAVKIRQELPYYWLSEEDNIILCGKIDWLEYLEPTDSVHIIDFKTGKKEESKDSLQLPIYHLLVKNTQKREVSKASYWYLMSDNAPREVELPELEDAHKRVYALAKKIQTARKLDHFKCPREGCMACTPLEKVLRGEAEKVAVSQYRQDIYVIKSGKKKDEEMPDSDIL